MRITAGVLRGRQLLRDSRLSKSTLKFRPTTQRLRAALFNIIADKINGARFLDIFAGTGSVGIEAISRGASNVVFIERSAKLVKLIRANLLRLGISVNQATIISGDAFLALEKINMPNFDIIFLDPPYDRSTNYIERTLEIIDANSDKLLSSEGSLVIVQAIKNYAPKDNYNNLKFTRLHRLGDDLLIFYQRT